jgi:hypothetical protein
MILLYKKYIIMLFLNTRIQKIGTSTNMMKKDIVKINNNTENINHLKYDVHRYNKLSRGSITLFFTLLTSI